VALERRTSVFRPVMTQALTEIVASVKIAMLAPGSGTWPALSAAADLGTNGEIKWQRR